MKSDPRFLLGADPELFCVNKNGDYISAVGKFGGTKEKPKPMKTKGFFVQEDNVAVEFNIPPAASDEDFVRNISIALKELEHRAKAKNLFLSITASASFTPTQLRSRASCYFGCDPDYNAWTMGRNPRPNHDDFYLRSCGGHEHFGWLDKPRNPWLFVRWLDLYQACPMILVDKDSKRRKLYGKAGAFREKPYGVEYRTLSNYWLSSPDLMRWLYAQATKAVNAYDAIPEYDLEEFKHPINACVNQGDMKAYELLASKFDLQCPPI